MDILFDIVNHKKEELAEFKQFIPPTRLLQMVQQQMDDEAKQQQRVPSMRASLIQGSGIIAEFKRKSPSKGWIHKDARPEVVTRAYQDNGASALSILTDRMFFGGYDEYIQIARKSGVTIPILYKNFVIDPYQLLQARHCGASAVLLIAACLEKDMCRMLLKQAHELGLEVLLEMHSAEDLDYCDMEPDIYGINNRNLGSFHTDVANSFALAERLPKDVCKVSESGIGDAKTIQRLRSVGFSGFLIGETLMREADPGKKLRELSPSPKGEGETKGKSRNTISPLNFEED